MSEDTKEGRPQHGDDQGAPRVVRIKREVFKSRAKDAVPPPMTLQEILDPRVPEARSHEA